MVQGYRELSESRKELEARRSLLDSELQALSELAPTAQSEEPIVQELTRLKQGAARQASDGQATISGLESKLAACREELARHQIELNSLEPLRRVWAARQFWKLDWWKALRGAEQRRRAAVLADQIQGLERSVRQRSEDLDGFRLAQIASRPHRLGFASALAEERVRRENLINTELAQVSQRTDQLATVLAGTKKSWRRLDIHLLLLLISSNCRIVDRTQTTGQQQLDRAGQWLA